MLYSISRGSHVQLRTLEGGSPCKGTVGAQNKGGGGFLHDINGYSVPDVDFSASLFLVVDAPRMRDRLGILEFIVVLASRLCSPWRSSHKEWASLLPVSVKESRAQRHGVNSSELTWGYGSGWRRSLHLMAQSALGALPFRCR